MRVSFSQDAPQGSLEASMVLHLKQQLLQRALAIYDPADWLTVAGWARHERVDRRTLTGWLKACDLTIGDVRVYCSKADV